MPEVSETRQTSGTQIAQLTLLRPSEGTTLTPGGRVNVIGWVESDHSVLSVEINLSDVPLGSARINIDPEQLVALTGHRPAERTTNFIFIGVVPNFQPGEARLSLRVAVVGGQHIHTIRVKIAENPASQHPADSSQENQTQHTTIADAATIRTYLDFPICKDGMAIETVRGFLSIIGWAFSDAGIDHIDVFVDGDFYGRAHHGTRREDVEQAFPGVGGLMSGFAVVIPPTVMKDGEHGIRLCIIAKSGTPRDISFRVRCERALTGPGPWMLRTKIPASETLLQHAILTAAGCSPHWAIVIATPDDSPTTCDALARTIEGLRWQTYANWTVVVVTANPQHTALKATAASFDWALAGRVQVVRTSPKRPLTDLVGKATSVIVLRPGDQLGEDALLELSLTVANTPDADFLYSDERRIDPADGTEKAFFKPAFSPDLLLSTNYIGRLWSASTALMRSADLCQSDLQRGDYHLVLALTERACRIVHIPKVLCQPVPLPLNYQRDQTSLRMALLRRDIKADVLPGAVQGTYRIRRNTVGGMVSIIIPTIASQALVKIAVGSIRANTTWPDYEIIIVDNFPEHPTPEQRQWRAWFNTHADRALSNPQPFNWSRLNNAGAVKAKGQYLLFLNDDVEVRDCNWLNGLVEQAQRPEVGVVGPQLLYPDGRVQHAGVFLGRRAGRHAFRYCASDEPGPFGLALTQRNVISVTGACMMMRRDVFDRLGGFDEHHAIINNDVDFGLRAHRAGLWNVYTPTVSLIHHEQVSRAAMPDTYNAERFNMEWAALFDQGDPFFNRHLSLDSDDYAVEAEPVELLTTGHPVVARDQVRRILAIKVDHIGDFVTALPAFRHLKNCFPNARLTVLAAKASMSLARLETAIDEVIEFNFFHTRSEKGLRKVNAQRLAKLRSQLAPMRFDLALDLRRQPETRGILRSTGARWLAGFDHGYEHPWLDFSMEFERDVATKYKKTHIADALVNLVNVVSQQCDLDRRVISTKIDLDTARAFMNSLIGVTGANRLEGCLLVIVHPGAGGLTKRWQPKSFAGLIDLLVDKLGVCVAIIGSADEISLVGYIITLLQDSSHVFNLVGKATLRQIPLLIGASDLYVGNDSGPKHIAAALGVPTVGVHSGAVDPTEWGAAGPYAVNVRRRMVCSPCYIAHATDCHRSMACLTGLLVGDVFAACQRLLMLAAKPTVESYSDS